MYIIENIAQVQKSYDWSCISNIICIAVNNGKNKKKKEPYQNQLSKDWITFQAVMPMFCKCTQTLPANKQE